MKINKAKINEAKKNTAKNNEAFLVDSELLSELKSLFFSTKKLSTASVIGGYRSAYKGRGVEFEELREYQIGDDVRTIDWKVTARTSKLFVKSYREERDLSIVIAVDLSSSTITGSSYGLKNRLIAKIAAALSFIAVENRDRVGLLSFAGDVIAFTPPKRSKSIVWKSLHDVLGAEREYPNTSISNACNFLLKSLKSNTVVFIVSDFCDNNFHEALGALARKHDVTAILTSDPIDRSISEIGLLRVKEPESGKVFTLDFSNKKVLKNYAEAALKSRTQIKQLFEKAQVKAFEISTKDDIAEKLREYFSKKTKFLNITP